MGAPRASLSRGELGQVSKEVVCVEKLMQLHTSAFQALGEIGTTLEMSQTRMKGACRFSPRGCIHRVYIPPEFLVGLTCPFAAT